MHLLGVYWMFETVYRGWNVDDHWLLKPLRPRVHRHGLKFLWIPFWSAYNVHLLDDYRSYYFDLAFLQPNYMFYKEGKSLEAAAEAARRRGAGIEMEYYLELDEPIGVTGERHSRFRDYLNGGVTSATCARPPARTSRAWARSRRCARTGTRGSASSTRTSTTS